MDQLRILGLPPHLATPPDDLPAPDDPTWQEKADAMKAWAIDVMRYRVERRRLIERQPALIPIELRYCSNPDTGPIYWILMYGWIFEPRPRRGQLPDKPFILYRFQIDLIMWALRIIRETTIEDDGAKADGAVSKSRDMGATWCFCALALWGWLFDYPWQVRLISYRADEVDGNTSDSMFYKVSYILARCPSWMYPKGFNWETNRHKNELLNPENGNAIAGLTSTGRSGRGNRATWILYDEAAINQYLEESWSSTANVTDHRFVVSSEHLEYNILFNKLTQGAMPEDETPSRFPIDYWKHPEHTWAWAEGQRRRMASDPGKFEREVLRNPRAESPTIVYPATLQKQPVYIEYVPGAPILVGIDPGFNDQCGIVWLQKDPTTGRYNVLNAYMNRKKTAAFYATIIRGFPYLKPPDGRWDIPDEEWTEATRGDGTPPTDEWKRVGWDEEKGDWDWTYTEADLMLMEWTRQLPRPTAFYGDTSGDNNLGATKDTVYSIMAGFGILVNRDRLPNGDLSAYRKRARTYAGRQEATKAVLPRMEWADTPGGRLCLEAFQNYRWADTTEKPRQVEPKTPLHTEASHLVTATEYILVNEAILRDVTALPKRPKAKARRGYTPKTLAGRTQRMMVPTGRM